MVRTVAIRPRRVARVHRADDQPGDAQPGCGAVPIGLEDGADVGHVICGGIEHEIFAIAGRAGVATQARRTEVGCKDVGSLAVNDQHLGVGIVEGWIRGSDGDVGRAQLLQHTLRRDRAIAERVRFEQHAHVQAARGGILQRVDHTGVAQQVNLDPDRARRRLDSPYDWRGSGLRLDEDGDTLRGTRDREACSRAGGGWQTVGGGAGVAGGDARGEREAGEQQAAEEIGGSVRPARGMWSQTYRLLFRCGELASLSSISTEEESI